MSRVRFGQLAIGLGLCAVLLALGSCADTQERNFDQFACSLLFCLSVASLSGAG